MMGALYAHMPQTPLHMAISHRYVNSRRPLGRDSSGLSIMTANIWTFSLEKLNKYVNFAIIVQYSLEFEPGNCIATAQFTALSVI